MFLSTCSIMNTSDAIGPSTVHLILNLPNGKSLEHQKVPSTESLWGILTQFQSQFNQNLCRRYNNENRFECPHLHFNQFPIAGTLHQLCSTSLADIASHRQSAAHSITLTLSFKAAAFSIHDLDDKLTQTLSALKQQQKGGAAESKSDDVDDEEMGKRRGSALDEDFAMDIDPEEAESVEAVFRKMERTLYSLTKELTVKEDFVECTKLLQKVVSNLIKYPLDSPSAANAKSKKDPTKFRKLNLENEKLKQKLFRFKSALDLLLLIGFVKEGQYLVMPPQREQVVVFQALLVKIGNCQPPKAAIPVVDKEVKLYRLDDLRKFKVEEARIIAQEAAKKADSAPSESALAAQSRAAALRAYKKQHPTELMGKELREKKYGIKQKQYRFTVIRVEFPSGYVLEAKFHPDTAISALFEWVESFLDHKVKAMKYQLLLPPHQIIKNEESQTFRSIGGMIPACTVRFALSSKANGGGLSNGRFLREDLIAKHLTKNITSLRADKLRNSVAEEDEQKEEAPADGKQKKKTAKMTAAEFKAMKRKKALENKLRKLNAAQ